MIRYLCRGSLVALTCLWLLTASTAHGQKVGGTVTITGTKSR